MKIFTCTSSPKVHPEFGIVTQIKVFVFGFHFWTEHHAVEAPAEEEVNPFDCDLEEITGFQRWKREFEFTNLSNIEFDKFQQQQISKI